MKEVSFTDTVGFSVKDTLSLYWLYRTQQEPVYSKELHEQFTDSFPGRKVGYDYVARVAKQLEAQDLLSGFTSEGKRYYQVTPAGLEQLQHYAEQYKNRFHEVKLVLDRIYYHLTRDGGRPPEDVEPLADEFRGYFSRLVSVKDLVRLIALQLGRNRSSFYMAEAGEQLNYLFGWSPSNGYLYQVAREMEETGLITGYWPDERRTVRYLVLTDAGNEFYDTVVNSTVERLRDLRHFLSYILEFLDNRSQDTF